MTTTDTTRVLASGIICLTLFSLLTILVFSHILRAVDETLFVLINQDSAWRPISGGLVFISIYGREVFWSGVLITLWYAGGRTHRNTVFTLIGIFVVVSVLGVGLKAVLYRPRPYDTLPGVQLLLAPLGDSSFPSGHALIVAAGGSTAWLRLPKRYATPLLIEGVLVAFSRIYGGVHYPLDVVAGSLFGIGVTCVIIAQLPSVESLLRRMYRYVARVRPRSRNCQATLSPEHTSS